MAFDAGMLACVVNEIRTACLGGKIEKIYQPEKEELHFSVRANGQTRRLIINAGSSCPRIGFSTIQKENPISAPMFCMLLRKHLSGSTLTDVRQEGFERVVRLTFDTRDEMGFDCKRHIIAEIMGKYSNLMFTDENDKIISALKIVDFTTSSLRQVLPGMLYELPPTQSKRDPIIETQGGFFEALGGFPDDMRADKAITSVYLGISASNAREIVWRAAKKTDACLGECSIDSLWCQLSALTKATKGVGVSPCVVFDGTLPVEYSFILLTQYGNTLTCKEYPTVSEALDVFFESRDREQRIKQRAADIFRMLTNAESRLQKKLDSQRSELRDCEMGEKYKQYGDLITSNLYMLSRGQHTVELVDYSSWDEDTQDYGRVVISLDERLTPAANAQRYYKKYNKTKTARVELTRQIEAGERELEYIYSVFDALTKAENSADLAEIRDELYRSGYASRMKGYSSPKKQPTPSVAQFKTTNGYLVLCGKNNMQNEYITHKLAQKHDYWFHAKNTAGSHVLMVTHGEEPPAEDFTDACMIAAYYSKAKGGEMIEVDYLLAKGVKKVSGAKPGFVIYHNNWSAYVTPDEEKIRAMRIH